MKFRAGKTEPGAEPSAGPERRKDRRVPTPTGMWVSWKFEKQRHTSRVLDFSASGAFIVTNEVVAVGTPLKLIFAMVEGELKVEATVRNVTPGRGMGVQFLSVGGKELALILKALKRLRPW
ncbi:MAG TPA: PilZ domain-containing protein [Candidatus Acidoferrum sp.]|nr:PilZ domain-containing protein [Candidatus Acidoferrum sp.]